MIGKRLEVLVEGASEESEHLLVGRHQGQAPEVDGQIYINDGMAYPGDLVTVEVTESHDYDLVGTIVSGKDHKGCPREIRSLPAEVQ
jgi:ribosomal protein S12 methylthiotransferase